jgi:hypothetical protein
MTAYAQAALGISGILLMKAFGKGARRARAIRLLNRALRDLQIREAGSSAAS